MHSVAWRWKPRHPRPSTEADLLFELLIIAFDAPAQFDGVDKLIERDVGRQSREPVFGRFGLALGPFDNQPLLGAQFGAQIVAMSRMGRARARNAR